MISVPIRTQSSLEVGRPERLFDPGGAKWRGFDVSQDGRFLASVQIGTHPVPLTVVVNGPAGVQR